jgi:hypothetical protein
MTITRRAMIFGAGCLAVGSLDATNAFADGPPAGRRIALSGYDPIAYFIDGKPAKGSPEFWYAFDDVVYLFRSAQHRETFAADPERYAPQYDGYCAGGISKGYKVEPDPEAWIVANGKLFVFQFQDRVPMFRKTIEEVSTTANKNWPALRNK